MTVVESVHSGKVIPLSHAAFARADPGEAIGVPPAPSNSNDLQNVVPFLRPRAAEAHAPVVLPGDVVRPPEVGLARERVRLAGFAAISLLVHGALFAAFWREPDPFASIGVEVITAEIIIGAAAPAGVEPTPDEQQESSPVVAAEQKPDEQMAEAQQQATEQPQSVQTARQETMPEEKTEQPKTEQPKAEEKTTAPQQSEPAEQKPEVAMVESSVPDAATAAPREVPPDAIELSRLPQPERPLEPKAEVSPVPKPARAAPKPVKNAAPAKERRRIEAPTTDRAVTQAKASTPSTAANGVGIGRSDVSSNYSGMVSAHLRRYQQYPSDARSRGDQGSATVSFSLDGGGRVTSSRLARGSGIASIDGEVQAMVRRASPFPAPPGGSPRSFTVPVSFRLN